MLFEIDKFVNFFSKIRNTIINNHFETHTDRFEDTKLPIFIHHNQRTHRADEADDRLSLILLRYSDGLIRWFEPSEVPFGKLGGTNGRTSCLFTKFGPFDRDWPADDVDDDDADDDNCCWCCAVDGATDTTDDDAQYCAWYAWYSSDDVEALPPPLLFWCCTDDVVPLISRAFLFAAEMDVNIKNPPTKFATLYHLTHNKLMAIAHKNTHRHRHETANEQSAINDNNDPKKTTEYNRINKLTKKWLSNFVPAERKSIWIFNVDKTRTEKYLPDVDESQLKWLIYRIWMGKNND